MNYTQSQLDELKKQYDEAVFAYYQTDSTIMSDMEFDNIKDILETYGYDVSSESVVEDTNTRQKLTSTNNMLSLKKVSVFSESFTQNHLQQVRAWLSQYDNNLIILPETKVLVGWKLDGCAISLRYNDGKLVDVVTRGNFSIKEKFLEVAKKFHPTSTTDEIRCEVLMNKQVFDEKYSEDYANPRNLVAGILNDIQLDDNRIHDLEFIKINNGISPDSPTINSLSYQEITLSELPNLYNEYLSKRNSYQYLTDGLVIYLTNISEFKAIGKYPLHSLAIKFPPIESVTKVKEIVWNLKKSGTWVPKAILEPVLLDGSTVTKSLVFNYGYIIEKELYPGALVVVAKNGDIIPYIQRVLQPGDPSRFNYPQNTIVVGKHLLPASNSEAIKTERFIAGCYCLGIKDFGYAWFKGLSKLCHNDITRLFNGEVVQPYTLKELFGGDKKITKFISKLYSIRSINIKTLLLMLQIPKLGPATADVVARKLSGLSYSTTGMEKSVLNDCFEGESSIRISQALSNLLGYGIEIEFLFDEPVGNIEATFEMTGSPKGFGFPSKSEFIKSVPNWKHTKLDKTTTYLVTDDPTSTTGKMAKAIKQGTKIITYSQAIKLHN